MSILTLTTSEQRALAQQLHATDDARIYRRTLALLQLARGQPIVEVARTLQVGRRSVARWLANYRKARKPQSLCDRPGRGRPRLLSADDRTFLDQCLSTTPAGWGYPVARWTVPLLQAHLLTQGRRTCSSDTLRRYLDELDWVWKRPRYMLEPDPEREKKTPYPNSPQASGASYPRAL